MARTSAPNGVASMYRMLSYACSGRGHVGHRERDAGGHLDQDEHQGGAAEGVPPADVAGDLAVEERTTQGVDAEPLVEPGADAAASQAPGSSMPTWTVAVHDLGRVLDHGSGWRPAGHVAHDVEVAAVTGTHELAGAAAERQRTAEVGAMDVEGTEVGVGLAHHVDGHGSPAR